MPRKHLFIVVVLLGAAAVAALLAFSRAGAAPAASSTQIAAKSQSLDRLEASLQKALAEQPTTASPAGGRSAPTRTLFVRAGAPAATGGYDDEDEHEEEHEEEHGEEHEGADD